MGFTGVITQGVRFFEAVAVAVLVVGLLWAVGLAGALWRRTGDGRQAAKTLRATFGTVLLLALEILIAADLIKTVAVAATLTNVAALGLIVLIRTFLSFSLQIEIEGAPPWRRSAAGHDIPEDPTGPASR